MIVHLIGFSFDSRFLPWCQDQNPSMHWFTSLSNLLKIIITGEYIHYLCVRIVSGVVLAASWLLWVRKTITLPNGQIWIDSLPQQKSTTIITLISSKYKFLYKEVYLAQYSKRTYYLSSDMDTMRCMHEHGVDALSLRPETHDTLLHIVHSFSKCSCPDSRRQSPNCLRSTQIFFDYVEKIANQICRLWQSDICKIIEY